MSHKTKESGKKRKKKPSSKFYPKVSDKRGRTLPHKVQNTKDQYQDWKPEE
jgi:hypothetical protein